MPKKKKTRKQKILADSRQHTDSVENTSQQIPTYSVASVVNEEPNSQPKISHKATSHISTIEYSYLSKDLLKTLTLTGSIIVAEIILLYFTKGV